MKNILKLLLPLSIVIIIAAAAWWSYKTFYRDKVTISFKTENVLREDLTSSISASGTVEPEELINVSAQVSGKIMSFGKDTEGNTVDYRSYVKAGTLLAQIDDVLYAAALREAKAQKLQAEAAITSAKASIRQSDARLNLADINWKRARELYQKNATSKSEYDSAEANYISAQADLERANAQLAIAEAALIKAQRNLDYCAITAPVDGIIIDRRVSIGQTIVSNMSASSIFLIAKDFKRMEVWVSVNEADIGHVKVNMPAEFTIDTFPGTVFTGTVKKVRLNATMSQNVVTYIVEVVTDNKDGKLLPYLTANVKFIRQRKKDVLTVSNAALRFVPEDHLLLPEFRGKTPEKNGEYVYVAENGLLKPVKVKTGLRAAGRVEVIDSELTEGMQIVYGATEISTASAGKNPGAKSSPFMPKPENNKVRGGGSAANRARAQQAK